MSEKDSNFESVRYADAKFINSPGKYLRFTAKDSGGGEVLITALPGALARNPQLVRQFRQQVEVLGKQNHRNYINLLDTVGPEDGSGSHHAMITESMPTDLTTIANASGPLLPSAVISILKQILAAVDSLHRANHLHLGLSSDLIGTNNSCSEIKLLSLGSYYSMSDSDAAINDDNPKYGAPELYVGSGPQEDISAIGPFTDIYSVGMIGYELLVGPKAFNKVFRQLVNEKNKELRDKKWVNWHRESEPAPSAQELNPDVPESLSNLISSMMSKDPQARPGNVTECLNLLNSDNTIERKSDPEINRGSVAKKSAIPAIIYGVCGVALIIGGFLSYNYFFRSEPATVEPVVSVEEFKTLAARNRELRDQIEELKFTPDDLFEAGQANLVSARESESEGIDAQFSFLKASTDEFQQYFDQQTADRKETLLAKLKKVAAVAVEKRTRDLASVDFSTLGQTGNSDPVSVKESLLDLEQIIEQYEFGIARNPRNYLLGSSGEEIDEAVVFCKSYSNECSRSWYEDELERDVVIGPFEMDMYEVNVNEFRAYVDKEGILTEAEERNETSVTSKGSLAGYYTKDLFWHNQFPQDHRKYPVTHVTRLDASRYCTSIDKRLPTEAEWEYAARGVQRSVYPWGPDWEENGIKRGGLPQEPNAVVGTFEPGTGGHYDLSGSVTEWTSTDADADGIGTAKGGSRFDDNPANLRLAVRRYLPIVYSGDDVGFRCARSTQEWKD